MGLIDVLDLSFDLKYGGANYSLEELYSLGYDDLYFLKQKLKVQKEFEEKQMKKKK